MRNSEGLHQYEDIYARLEMGERPTPAELAEDYDISEEAATASAYYAGRANEKPVSKLDGQFVLDGTLDDTERIVTREMHKVRGYTTRAGRVAARLQDLIGELPAAKRTKYSHWLPHCATLAIMGEQAKYLEDGKH